MVEKVLEEEFGERVFRNCDVVDMTFACVGGVDALHNSLDFVRVNPDKKQW
jgi:hydroxymethylglutaryl-CoA synthase